MKYCTINSYGPTEEWLKLSRKFEPTTRKKAENEIEVLCLCVNNNRTSSANFSTYTQHTYRSAPQYICRKLSVRPCAIHIASLRCQKEINAERLFWPSRKENCLVYTFGDTHSDETMIASIIIIILSVDNKRNNNNQKTKTTMKKGKEKRQ